MFLFGIPINQELRHGEDMSTESHLISGALELHKVPTALFPLCLGWSGVTCWTELTFPG